MEHRDEALRQHHPHEVRAHAQSPAQSFSDGGITRAKATVAVVMFGGAPTTKLRLQTKSCEPVASGPHPIEVMNA